MTACPKSAQSRGDSWGWLGQQNVPISRFLHGGLKRHVLTLKALKEGMGIGASESDLPITAFSEYRHQDILAHYDPGLLQRWQDEFAKSGRIDGADFRRHFRTALRLWIEGEILTLEPFTAFRQRVMMGFEALSQMIEDQETVLLVTSNGVISLLVSEILQAPPLKAFENGYGFYNCGLSDLRRSQNQWALSGLNQIAHIEITKQKHLITTI